MDNGSKPQGANGFRRSGSFTIMSQPQGIFRSQAVAFRYYIDEDGMCFIRQSGNNFSHWTVGQIPNGAKLNN